MLMTSSGLIPPCALLFRSAPRITTSSFASVTARDHHHIFIGSIR